jgi:hypothetical protein
MKKKIATKHVAPTPVKKPATKPQEAKTMSKHPHNHESDQEDAGKTEKKAPFESGDLAKDFPAAHEDLNRAVVHTSDRVKNALERSKKAGASAKDVSRINALAEKLRATHDEIDAIAAKAEKEADEK